MAFPLPPLPYDRKALEPHISAETLDYHHGKHHAGYVSKLNALVKDSPDKEKCLEDLICTASGGIYNNAAQIWNHTFYFRSMKQGGGGCPKEPLATKINEAFGSFEKFKEQFSQAAVGHFGSGWAWLCWCIKSQKATILQTHDAENPMRDTPWYIPLLTCDVWEHAYYIDRRNDRAGYIQAWWSLVDWDFANANLKAAMS